MTSRENPRFDAAVIGAGMAGLSAARELLAAGLAVVVLDKARGVGGRMATRRMADAVLDHGAQFFTVRGSEFAAVVEAAASAGRVVRWCDGFARAATVDGRVAAAADGHPRWRGAQAMTDLPKHLAAELRAGGVPLRTDTRVTAVAAEHDGVRLTLDGGEVLVARGCVMTPPVPQSLDLFS
ncbi:MAG: FAD-dependent oxidoreductase, partial [Planctomycetia bacterium]|nr:FAD-dependent oxidoreductase [Planctomycetia bacterium]